MVQYLKQNTAVTLKVGPFLDSTDGNTPETALTITNTEVRLSKNGADIVGKNEASSLTHDELGWYDCPVNATDINTLGRLDLMVHEAGALQVWHQYMVVPANVWDSLFGADALQVHAVEMSDDLITAAVIATDAIGSNELATAAVNEIRDAILSDSTAFAGANIDAAVTSRATPAQVNAEVVDALNVDTYAEPAQGTPAATTTLVQKLGFLYKFMRNRITSTGTTISVFNDDAATVDHKSTHSDDGTTYDRGEFVSGP